MFNIVGHTTSKGDQFKFLKNYYDCILIVIWKINKFIHLFIYSFIHLIFNQPFFEHGLNRKIKNYTFVKASLEKIRKKIIKEGSSITMPFR